MGFSQIKERVSRYAVAGIIAGSLALAALPCAAFAADASSTTQTGTDSTAVYLKGGDNEQLTMSISAPTEIHVVAKADGTFVTPSAEATQIKNASIFGVHVDKITATAENNFNLVANAAQASEDNAIQYSVQPNSGTALQISDYVGGKEITGSDWDMTKAGGSNDHLNLTTAGAINNVTKDLSADQQFATLSWTFASGANA